MTFATAWMWLCGGMFTDHPSHSHWHDYACTTQDGVAMLAAAVPESAGLAFLWQKIFADDYRGAIAPMSRLSTLAAVDPAGSF